MREVYLLSRFITGDFCVKYRFPNKGGTMVRLRSPRAYNRPFVLPSLFRGGDTRGFFDGLFASTF